MITTNELRRNNLLSCHGEIFSVHRILEDVIVLKKGQETRRVAPEEVEGVALSPEVLEGCGFEEFVACYTLTFDNMRINIITESMCVKLSDLIWNNRQELLHIKYLHQLQNLFNGLSGSELTINLEKVKV